MKNEKTQNWSIKEQIVKDLPTGLTLQFETREDETNVLKIFGDFPFGNREIIFSKDGEEIGGGTFLYEKPQHKFEV